MKLSNSTSNSEIEFNKYKQRGAYHWDQISNSIRDHNAFVVERYAAVIRAAHPLSGKKVLDLGCGDAALSFLLHKEGAIVTGLDLDLIGVQLGRQKLMSHQTDVPLAIASGYDVPFAEGSFDCVICSEVIEHVQLPERLLQEIWRVLTKNGKVVLTTPHRLKEHPDRYHVQEFFPDQLAARLEENGFSSVNVSLSNPVAITDLYHLKFPVMNRPLFRYLFNMMSIVGHNPFKFSGFRIHELLIATGSK